MLRCWLSVVDFSEVVQNTEADWAAGRLGACPIRRLLHEQGFGRQKWVRQDGGLEFNDTQCRIRLWRLRVLCLY